jgi:glycogen(starch) synthase
LRIAYISYEHPAGISGGGIGTYIGQISALMAARGHSVEAFSGTLSDSPSTIKLDGYRLNLIPAKNTTEFRARVVAIFSERHTAQPFDIIESPEYGADGLEIKKAFPNLPLTLKLHTPAFLIAKLNELKNRVTDKLRFVIGGLIRLQRIKFYWVYDKKSDPEYELFNLANSVSSPSISLAKIVAIHWKSQKQITVIPYPFQTNGYEFKPVNLPQKTEIVITFIGRIEKRKGIMDLMKAVPAILNSFPDIKFRFAGSPSLSPVKGLNMEEYLVKKLAKYSGSLEFLGLRPYQQIPLIIQESHICVFPSLWENFPNVCLEAMLGGRVVIGTNNGGMADIITNNINGILIPPGSPMAIAEAVKKLCGNPSLIRSMGNAARQTVMERYNGNVIGKLTEDFYRQIINTNG